MLQRKLVTQRTLDMQILKWRSERIDTVQTGSGTYRSRQNRNGDLMIFSDVHWTPLDLWIDLEINE
jgi:hypothetical protein